MGWGLGCNERHKKKGMDIYIHTHIANSLCCTVETSTTLQSNYTPIKINLRKEVKLADILIKHTHTHTNASPCSHEADTVGGKDRQQRNRQINVGCYK